MFIKLDRQVMNVVHLGLSFLVLFSADFTLTNMQKTINTSITEDKPDYHVDGYISMGLIYLIYGIFLWLAPSLVAAVGAKWSMFIGSTCITIFFFTFMLEIDYTTYVGILFGGLGGSFVWVAEGNYLVMNSDPDTVTRNVGLFWFIYTGSLICGNCFAVFRLEGKTRIDYDTRQELLQVIAVLGIIASIMFALLGAPKRFTNYQEIKHESPIEALKKTWQIFRTKELLILLITFCYGGFQQSFGSGVYPACVGFTKTFGNRAKQLVPLSGLIYGLGDSMGGLTTMLLAKMQLKFSRWNFIALGFLLQVIAYSAIYLNIPDEAVFGETFDSAIIQSRIWLSLLCSILIGIGDSCLNTQIFPLIADLEPDHSAHICALYKFSKSMAMAAYFFCSISFGLHLQLIILLVMGLAGTAAFSWVDIKQSTNKNSKSFNDIT
ncbi:hypothetical protein O3M35_004975 [Rhynocoris fuscipes]|uniref:UNC93-like protein MFSD11 n=1 Tax=Rhynocoris fuscipes TaxID=488301 RepID=A0AAW1DHX1_9HEMI